VVKGPAAQQHVERAALERAELRRVRSLAPEGLERLARAVDAAARMPVHQHRRVHRAGGGARHALDLQPGFLEDAVEHAPGEGAMGAAALQREVDLERLAPRPAADWLGHRFGSLGWKRGGAIPGRCRGLRGIRRAHRMLQCNKCILAGASAGATTPPGIS